MSNEADGTRLRTVRETLGLSQRDFAKELGVTPGALGHWEIGRRPLPGPILLIVSLYEEHLQIGKGDSSPPPLLSKPRLAQSSSEELTASIAYATAAWGVLQKAHRRPGATSLERSVRDAAIANYVTTLGGLTGLRMKLGQMLANVDAISPLLYGEGIKPLSSLALHAPPMAPLEVVEVFLDQFEQVPRDIFARWSPEPAFSASLGQVHRATLKSGEEVAVKIQSPRFVETLESDLQSIDLIDRLYCAVNPGQQPGTFFQVLRECISEECDFTKEAANGRRFERVFTGRSDMRFPKVFDAFSRKRVLTTSFASGQSFQEFAASADQAARDRAGQAIWDFVYQAGSTIGVFNADPHPSNLVFQPDGQVTFLDHGCVARMSKEFLAMGRQFLRAVCEKDRARALELFARMGFCSPAEAMSTSADDAYRCILLVHSPWLLEGRFSFTAEYAQAAWRLYDETRSQMSLSLPRDAVLWSQLLWGVYSLLIPLRCSIESRANMLRLTYGADERTPPAYTREDFAKLGVSV